MDCIGCCQVGDDVKIGDNVSFAENIVIGDNVEVEDDCIIQGVGHEIYYQGRRLQILDNNQLKEICTVGSILIKDNLTLRKSTFVSPHTIVTSSTDEYTTILPGGKVIYRNQEEKTM